MLPSLQHGVDDGTGAGRPATQARRSPSDRRDGADTTYPRVDRRATQR